MKIKIGITVFLLMFVCHEILAQDINVDSLISIAEKMPDDTNKMKVLNSISGNAPDGVWQRYNELLGKLSEKLMHDSNKKVAKLSKEYYSEYLNNKGFELAEKGDLKSALNYYLKCEKISLQLGDLTTLGLIYSSIGAVYERQNDKKNALVSYRLALKYNKASNAERNMVATYNNLGACYAKLNEADSSLFCLLEGIKIAEKNKFKNQIITRLLFNVGNDYFKKGDLKVATEYFNRGLQMSNEIGDNNGKADNLKGLSNVYSQTGDFKKALLYAQKAYEQSVLVGPYVAHTAAGNLKAMYEKQGDLINAYKMFKLEIKYRDSLNSIENQKGVIRYQFEHEYAIKEVKQKAAQEKKDAIALEELQKQKLLRNSFLGGFALVSLFAGVFFTQRNKIKKGKKLSDELLLNILPTEVAEELKDKGSAEAQQIDEVTVLFTDFKGFSQLAEKLTPKELVAEINECFSAFDYIMEKQGVEKIKTIGDAYMAAGGLPTANKTHAEDVVKAALDIQDYMQQHKAKKIAAKELFFEIRIGVHTGPVVAGIVGVKKFAYDIWGDTVNTANRMESSGEVGKVNISGTTYELIKDKFNCVYRGKVQAKGKGEIDMYFVE